jgi:large subunit ribosomal protein L15
MITLHSLHHSAKRFRPKRVGRGNATGKGTTAGRGTKGQRARTGGRNKLTRRGLKATLERTPKTRGFRSRTEKLETISVLTLEKMFPTATVITPLEMHKAGLIRTTKHGVKVLGQGPVKKKLTVKANAFSKGAAAAIAQAGGSTVVLGFTTPTE